ncbi:MAG TPA: SpoIIE family protein phosphatase [Thermoanaerobaculia bacterium]|jgi:serine phosphatase RsbU (regulator of sigma subunit)
MKIRTQLSLAFLLLAVVPLTGIVLYSYYSSLRAVRQATETEARSLTREMDGRMAMIRNDLGRGVERIGDVPMQALLSAARSKQEGRADPLLNRMVLGFGEAAPFIQSLEFIPQPPPARAPTSEGAPPGTSATPAAPVPPPPPGVKVLVDVPQILREVRKEMESVPGVPPEALQGIDESLRIETGRKLRERLAAQAEERRKFLAKISEFEQRQKKLADTTRTATDRSLLGRDFEMPVVEEGEVVGKVKARIRSDALLRGVLARNRSGEGDIPFAVDAEGNLHTVSDEDRRKIEKLSVLTGVHAHASSARWVLDDWAVATHKDPESGLIFGIARPVPLAEVRRTAARNFGYGLGMIGLALLGILPLSTRMTRNLRLVTAGADRIAQGDLDTRIPVRSRNEFGTLALTFNRMAEDLKRHQEREIEQALLHKEYERKTRELEEAREFQLSLLPKTLPEHPGFEIAVSMRTATEVGGDYYDFHLSDDGALTAAIGDATGHGARAGTMVTAVKSLFSADAGASGPREFLAEAAQAVKRMALDRMAMGLCLVRLEDGTLTVSSAGMPPLLLYRARTGRAEEVALAGMPLGGFAFDYDERRLEIDPSDTILLMTDGLPELTNGEGDPLGYPRVRSLFESLGAKPPEEVIAGLAAAAESWAGGNAPKDDITFVVIRARAAA